MSLLDKFNNAHEFARTKAPLLLPQLEQLKEHIYQLWVQEGMPGVTGFPSATAAFLWFDGVYTSWLQEQEATNQDNQQELARTLQEASTMGDIVLLEDQQVLVTPKGLARNLVVHFSLFVNHADQEQRGLEQGEVLSLEMDLLLGLIQLRNYKKDQEVVQ